MRIRNLWITLISLITLLTTLHINVNSNQATQNNLRLNQSTPDQSVPNSRIHIRIIHPKLTARPAMSRTRIRQDLKQMRTKTLSEIQSDRSLHGVAPIALNSKLNRLARVRAQQIAWRFDHYDHRGRPYTTDDAASARLPHGFRGSENIASTGLGNCITLGDPKTYHNHNGKQMAAMANDAMMNHDQLEANGHRKNILDSGNTLVGIGATYNPKKHEFYLAEDFGNHSPESSEDVNQVSTGQVSQSELRIILRKLKFSLRRIFNRGFNVVKRFIDLRL